MTEFCDVQFVVPGDTCLKRATHALACNYDRAFQLVGACDFHLKPMLARLPSGARVTPIPPEPVETDYGDLPFR
jgi:hypothetical protein